MSRTNGNGKSALIRINEHEKLCRIMQKETFAKIEELKNRIARLEKVLIISITMIMTAMGTTIFFLLNLLTKIAIH